MRLCTYWGALFKMKKRARGVKNKLDQIETESGDINIIPCQLKFPSSASNKIFKF